MKKKASVLKIVTPLLMLISACNSKPSSNLILNGSAELPRHDTVPKGWQNIKGNWTSVEGDTSHHDYAWAQDGKYIFFEGNDLMGDLQQQIDVNEYKDNIDAHKQKFVFRGYVQAFPQNPPDQSSITINCLNDAKNKTLYSFSSDTISSVSKWTEVTDTFVAPPLTRFITINLIANRRNGAANDGYFDNINVVALPSQNYLLIIIIIAIVIVAIGSFVYFRKKTDQ
ncbi:MAG: hypothetical protein ABI863_14000 [Ginsengibacter sp.]